jgi:hypothetical protein
MAIHFHLLLFKWCRHHSCSMHHSIHEEGGLFQSCMTKAPTQLLAIPTTAFITPFYGKRLTVSKTYQSSREIITYSCLRNLLIMVQLKTPQSLLKNFKVGLSYMYHPYIYMQMTRHLHVPIAHET